MNGIGNTISIKSKLLNNVHVKISGDNHCLIIEEFIVFSKGKNIF